MTGCDVRVSADLARFYLTRLAGPLRSKHGCQGSTKNTDITKYLEMRAVEALCQLLKERY